MGYSIWYQLCCEGKLRLRVAFYSGVFNKERGSLSGFTIVELLIVIVVVGILAAITIVGYNGVQDRARQAAAKSDVANAVKSIEAFALTEGIYPESITTCPPTSTSLCLLQSSGGTIRYSRVAAGTYIPAQSYNIGVLHGKRFAFYTPMEKTGFREYVNYVDIAPYIDEYGLREYKLSFDIKSADTSQRNIVVAYLQNGSNTKYSFRREVIVAEEYTHHEITFTPTLTNPAIVRSDLSFYGLYDTGNIPTVKNVRLEPL